MGCRLGLPRRTPSRTPLGRSVASSLASRGSGHFPAGELGLGCGLCVRERSLEDWREVVGALILHVDKSGEGFAGVSGGRVVRGGGVRGIGVLDLDFVGSAEEGQFYRHQCGFKDA